MCTAVHALIRHSSCAFMNCLCTNVMTPIQASLMNEVGFFSDKLSCVSTKPVHRRTFATCVVEQRWGVLCKVYRCTAFLNQEETEEMVWGTSGKSGSREVLVILLLIRRIESSGCQGRSLAAIQRLFQVYRGGIASIKQQSCPSASSFQSAPCSTAVSTRCAATNWLWLGLLQLCYLS